MISLKNNNKIYGNGANKENLRNFAASYFENGGMTAEQKRFGIFYVVTLIYNNGFEPPLLWLNGHNCHSRCRTKGQAKPFFLLSQNNKQCYTMSNRENICLLGNESTLQSTAQPSEMGKIFSYNGNNVTMRVRNGIVYVNLTEVAKSFPNKNLSHIINSQEIKEYCRALSEIQNCISADFLIVSKGGDVSKQGTWAHQKVALRVAQKLSPEFSVWVDTKIEELLTTGSAIVELSRKQLAQMVIEVEEEKERLALENEKQQKQIEKLQPKADFADAAFRAEGRVDIGQAAKILGLPFGRNTLFKKLREDGIFFTDRNEPKQKYVDAGYFILTQLPPVHRDNHPDIIPTKVLCEQKGLAYINKLYGNTTNILNGKEATL